MNSMMDVETLYVGGIRAVQWMQYSFKNFEKLMLFTTELGNPASAFILCFPLAYFLNYRLGLYVMWAASLSEWLNGILKWFLYGERPYWWIGEHKATVNGLSLKQYPPTCETGPGSPSGHCMVTAAAWYMVVSYLCFKKPRLTACFSKSVFFLVMSAVAISRCFIATHFPHQVVAGVISGVLCALVISRSPLADSWSVIYFIAAFFMIGTAFGLQSSLKLIGIDPNWTVSLAQKWCSNSKWVNANTNPMAAFIRDAASIFGAGVCVFFFRQYSGLRSAAQVDQMSSMKRFVSFVISTIALHSMQWWIHLKSQETVDVYLFMMLKSFACPIFVMIVVPIIVSFLFPHKQSNSRSE